MPPLNGSRWDRRLRTRPFSRPPSGGDRGIRPKSSARPSAQVVRPLLRTVPIPVLRRCFTVTATLILMTSAFVAGGDCGGCAAPAASCCDPCARVSCWDKMRARMALHKSRKADSCCDPCAKPAPTCCAPAPAPAPVCCPAPAPACHNDCGPKCHKSRKKDDCGCDPCAKPSLLDRLKARFHKKNDCCETASDCCGAAPAAPGAPATPTTPAPAPKPIPPTGKTTKLVVPSPIVPVSGNTF
jgi:hypothetical protein